MSSSVMLRFLLALLLISSAAFAEPAGGQSGIGAEPGAQLVDRTVVRFSAPETGGVSAPRFVFERVLAFEARLEAMQDPGYDSERSGPFTDTHLRAAMERHIAETLLSSLGIEPKPDAATVEAQMKVARALLAAQVGGEAGLMRALVAERLGTQALRRLLRRRALASLYLHHMVAPMLAPSDAQLKELYLKSGLSNRSFEEVRPELTRLYVGRALREAVTNFYQNARARLSITIL